MTVETITEAQAQFSALIDRVEDGETIIIKNSGKPVAVLCPYSPARIQRVPDALEGQIWIAEDFDELTPELAEAFDPQADS